MSIPIHSNKENRCKNSEIKYAKINSLGKFEVNPLTPVPAVIGRATCDPERFVFFLKGRREKNNSLHLNTGKEGMIAGYRLCEIPVPAVEKACEDNCLSYPP